jgi:hypothetical protein
MTTGSIWHLIGVTAAILLLTEGGLRWGLGLGDPPLARLDPVTEYELVGPALYNRWGNEISINADGMRAPEFDPTPVPNERRMLLIGDSVIYGGHFIDQSETISAHATQYLETDPFLTGCLVRVLPVAVSSWGPVNQASFLNRTGIFAADVAGIVVSSHDLYDVPEGAATILPYRTSAPTSALGDAILIVLERLFPKVSDIPVGSIEERASATLNALDDMVIQLRGDGLDVVIFYHPTIPERLGEMAKEGVIFQEWAAEKPVSFVNLNEVTILPTDYRDDIHPNALGTIKLAEIIATTFVDRIPRCKA